MILPKDEMHLTKEQKFELEVLIFVLNHHRNPTELEKQYIYMKLGMPYSIIHYNKIWFKLNVES